MEHISSIDQKRGYKKNRNPVILVLVLTLPFFCLPYFIRSFNKRLHETFSKFCLFSIAKLCLVQVFIYVVHHLSFVNTVSAFSLLINVHRRTPVLKFLFNKVEGLHALNFIKKKLQESFFSVNIVKFLRTPILKNICEW